MAHEDPLWEETKRLGLRLANFLYSGWILLVRLATGIWPKGPKDG